jgi:hypothetical protein
MLDRFLAMKRKINLTYVVGIAYMIFCLFRLHYLERRNILGTGMLGTGMLGRLPGRYCDVTGVGPAANE